MRNAVWAEKKDETSLIIVNDPLVAIVHARKVHGKRGATRAIKEGNNFHAFLEFACAGSDNLTKTRIDKLLVELQSQGINVEGCEEGGALGIRIESLAHLSDTMTRLKWPDSTQNQVRS